MTAGTSSELVIRIHMQYGLFRMTLRKEVACNNCSHVGHLSSYGPKKLYLWASLSTYSSKLSMYVICFPLQFAYISSYICIFFVGYLATVYIFYIFLYKAFLHGRAMYLCRIISRKYSRFLWLLYQIR